MKNVKYSLIAFFITISFFANAQVQTFEKFEELKSKYISNSSKDTISVINFWATWCVPCVKELPHFQEIDEIVLDGKPIKLTLVSLDFESKINSRLIPFLAKKKIKNEVVVLVDQDTNKWINQIDPKWSGAIPATLIIVNNKQYFFEKSYESTEELKKEIQTLIKK